MISLRFAAFASVLCTPLVAQAAPVWLGDFETNDLSQWNGTLNGNVDGVDYITIATDVVVQGSYSARVELHNDAVWPNGLKRVELHHSPDAGRTDEGATTWFAWSFYLPEALPEDPGATIGYWETDNSYQQMMAFNTNGETIRFITQRPGYVEHWVGDGVLTAGEWHRIAMRVLWSTNPDVGEVEVWYDGEQVVAGVNAQTLNDENSTFTQLGLLRGQVEFDDVPVIYLDDAVEGDSIEDVHPDLEPMGGTDSGSSSGGPSDSSGGADETTSASATGPSDDSTGVSGDDETQSGSATAASTDATASGSASATAGSDDTSSGTAGNDDDASGCACNSTPRSGSALALLAALGLVRRRRNRESPHR
ncbi:MAG TPA: polysaccharide lyase [Nannocystaceae bacterium]|nr:polysaccharide lyase [Nannocystaceae bacterium]